MFYSFRAAVPNYRSISVPDSLPTCSLGPHFFSISDSNGLNDNILIKQKLNDHAEEEIVLHCSLFPLVPQVITLKDGTSRECETGFPWTPESEILRLRGKVRCCDSGA